MRRNERYRPSAQRVAPATTALQLRGKLGKLRERGRSGAADRDATDATATIAFVMYGRKKKKEQSATDRECNAKKMTSNK